MDINYSLSENELSVLAFAAGISSFYGLGLGDRLPEGEDLVRCIYGMAKKKIIQEKGGKFRMEEPYNRIFEDIRRAEDILVVYHRDTEHAPKCVYLCNPDGENWMMEEEAASASRVRLRCITAEKFAECLSGQGYLDRFCGGKEKREEPESVSPGSGSGDSEAVLPGSGHKETEADLPESEPGEPEADLPTGGPGDLEAVFPEDGLKEAEEYLREPSCHMVVEKLKFDGFRADPSCALILRQSGSEYSLEFADGCEKERKSYSMDAFQEAIVKIWKGSL